MSGVCVVVKSRSKNNKYCKVRCSRQCCEELLACKKGKAYASVYCNECKSYQCEECNCLIHENQDYVRHLFEPVVAPCESYLCQGSCKGRNFADVTCVACDKNFCNLCDSLTHSKINQIHIRRKFHPKEQEFLPCEEGTDYMHDSNFLSCSNGMLHLSSLEPDIISEKDTKSEKEMKNISLSSNSSSKSFLFINDKEQLQVSGVEDFTEKLGCESNKLVKVVSIFGNTGDGKSYTLNHTFYNGEEIFQTSPMQLSCTFGVWAAYCPSLDLITIDTEGFLGLASNQNQRARLLLKVLAISDIVIYRTRAERLHNDMFTFLGEASIAYSRHFSQELEDASARCQIQGPLSVLGPAVIIFHETQHTKTLSEGDGQADIFLKTRFQELGLRLDAFSNLDYIGIRSESQPTNFESLKQCVSKHIKNSSVRMARSPDVIYKLIKVLNDKFSGNIEKSVPSTFPDQYFTCSVCCKSCKSRCSNSMNHFKDGIPHMSSANCTYQHQYENRIYLCKVCFERGEKIVVEPKTVQSGESSWIGLAKYAWAGYLLECSKCGIIYRSRQYWYGNKDPWEACVRTEICHVWPEDLSPKELQYTAQTVLDSLSSVTEVVSNISAKPTKLVSSWIADQIAPSYWTPNSKITHCGLCEKEFEELENKHHCRSCGGGFCEDCSSNSLLIPSWGSSPVRVCDKCYEKGDDAKNVQHPPDITARKVGEVVQSTIGTVASAVSYPIGFIKDSARPSYWVPDHLLKYCRVCKEEFSVKLPIHHCRQCGDGVCDGCSMARKPVQSKGWNYPVRVCDQCRDEDQ